MRRPSARVALSMIVLTGWMTVAGAQDAGVEPLAPSPAQDDTTNAMMQDQPLGVIPQPTPESPGLVTGVTLGELYTDNLRLAGPGKDKQSSWITEIQPFVKAATGGPRFSGMVDFSLTGYLYTGGSHRHQLAQNLNTQGTLTVLPEHFFIQGAATYGRAVINNEMPSGAGTFFLDNNRANIATASLSPYWIQEFGNAGTAMVRYAHARVVYNTRGIPGEGRASTGPVNLDHPGESRTLLAGVSNATSDAVQATLVSPEGRTFGWDLGYSAQRIERDRGGPAARFARAKAGIYWQVNAETRLLADAGKENKYLPDGSVEILAAPFWDAGFQWSAARDTLKVLVGHRFYGRSGEFSWTHTAALLRTTVRYIEQPTDLNQQLLGQGSIGIGLPPPTDVNQIPSLTQRRIYLMKRASFSADYEMPHGHLGLMLYDESRRYFTLNNQREKIANASLSWLLELGPFSTLTPTVGWQRYRYLDAHVNYTRYVQVALVHQINPSNFGSLRYRNDSRNAYFGIPGAHGYRVNVLFLEWTHLF